MPTKEPKQLNLNSLLITIVIGIASFSLKKQFTMAENIATLNEQVVSLRADSARHEGQIEGLLARRQNQQFRQP